MLAFGVLFFACGTGLGAEVPEFVVLSGGNFLMGDAFAGEGLSDELPVHTVKLDTFQAGSMPVSFGLWKSVRSWATVNGYVDLPAGRGKSDAHPVEGISWNDAAKWCNARSEKEGMAPAYKTVAGGNIVYRSGVVELTSGHVNWAVRAYRLPTEAEWEFAARGGQAGQRFPWSGGNVSHTNANVRISGWWNYEGGATGFYPGAASGNFPYASVPGLFAPNAYGLYDVGGNVWEWCWDYYGAGYYAVSEGANPRGASAGSYRVLRGGAWNADGESARLSKREVDVAAAGDYGFRLVLANDSGTVPVIVTQPSGGQFGISSNVTISVAVRDANEDGLSYQWYKNGNAISGATGAEISFARLGPKDAGNYSVDIANRHGTTSSTSASLDLLPFSSDDLLSHALNPDPMNTKSLLSYLPRIVLAGATLTVSYAAQDPALDYIVQTSTDLVNWTNQSSTNGVANVATDGADKMFARVMVESQGAGDTVYACTKPEGYVTIDLSAGPSTTYFGNPLESPAMYRFEVGTVATNKLTFANADFEGSQFTATPFIVRVITGNQAGRSMLVTANDGQSVTLDLTDGTATSVSLDQAGWNIVAGDIIEIAPADTLGSLFTGAIQGGTLPLMADTVSFWSGSQWVAYYYNTTSTKWTTNGTTTDTDKVIGVQDAWIVTKRNGRAATKIILTGTVPEQRLLTRIKGGSTIVANRFPIAVELKKLEFKGPGTWAKSPMALMADTLSLWTGSKWSVYWNTANETWNLQGGGSGDVGNTSVSAGRMISVAKRSVPSSGAQVFISQDIPYKNPRLDDNSL